MKKTIFATAMMLTVGMTSAFANKKDLISTEVTSSFYKDFSTAKEVQWQREAAYTKATFSMDDQIMFAYYNDNGELIGVVRNILSDKLPINLMSGLKKNYSNFWISDLFEMASDGQSNYYVTLETADETLVLFGFGGLPGPKNGLKQSGVDICCPWNATCRPHPECGEQGRFVPGKDVKPRPGEPLDQLLGMPPVPRTIFNAGHDIGILSDQFFNLGKRERNHRNRRNMIEI